MTSNSKHQSVTINDCTLYQGDCLDVLRTFRLNSVDAIVTDPPYGLVEPRSGANGLNPRTNEQKALRRSGFMGKKWDAVVPGIPVWQRALTIIKPGGYLLAFGGTRTYHRLTCAIEDAGWEIKDCLMWLYGQGFPKGKGSLKPSYEPLILARKPGKVLPLGIDECKIGTEPRINQPARNSKGSSSLKASVYGMPKDAKPQTTEGRYPANVVHDGSEEVMEEFEKYGEKKSRGEYKDSLDSPMFGNGGTIGPIGLKVGNRRNDYAGDTGSASRFFYCAKTSTSERGNGNNHPTVKPIALMEWLVKLVCQDGGTVLDMFMGSGSTGLACINTKRKFIGIELDPASFNISRDRVQGHISSSSSTADSVNEYLATKENKEEEGVE